MTKMTKMNKMPKIKASLRSIYLCNVVFDR